MKCVICDLAVDLPALAFFARLPCADPIDISASDRGPLGFARLGAPFAPDQRSRFLVEARDVTHDRCL